jgi:hypothetical protein
MQARGGDAGVLTAYFPQARNLQLVEKHLQLSCVVANLLHLIPIHSSRPLTRVRPYDRDPVSAVY